MRHVGIAWDLVYFHGEDVESMKFNVDVMCRRGKRSIHPVRSYNNVRITNEGMAYTVWPAHGGPDVEKINQALVHFRHGDRLEIAGVDLETGCYQVWHCFPVLEQE